MRGPLATDAEQLQATGNLNFGYFVGGSPSPSGSSRVQRLDYANDTNTAVLRGPTKNQRLEGGGFAPAANANPQ